MANGRCVRKIIPLPPPIDHRMICEPSFQKGKPKGRRVVLLVGGRSWELLEAYQAEAEVKAVNVRLHKLDVIFFEKGERQILRWGKEVQLSIGETVRGLNPEVAWQRVLKGRRAEGIRDPRLVAKEFSADLFCGAP